MGFRVRKGHYSGLRSGRPRASDQYLGSPGQSPGSLRRASSSEPGGEARGAWGSVAPPRGSPQGGLGRLRQQLLLPYKAGAGPGRGRGCVLWASYQAILAVPGGSGSAARRQREPSVVQSRSWASQVSPPGRPSWSTGMAREPRTPRCSPSPSLAAGWILGEGGACLSAGTRLRLRCGTQSAGWRRAWGAGPGNPAQAVSGAARKLGWLPGHQERGREGETEGGSPCLLARDCVREGFQALMGLALGVWTRRGFCIVSGGQS